MLNSSDNTKISNFWLRTLSTIILLPPVLYSLYAGGFLYFILLLVIIMLSGYEWAHICGRWSFGIDGMSLVTVIALSSICVMMKYYMLGFLIIIFGIYFVYFITNIRTKHEDIIVIPEYLNRPLWFTMGTFYLSVTMASMAYLSTFGNSLLILAFLGTVVSDISAYIFGSLIGGKKILPKVSPGKSWSGFIAASISTMILGYIFAVLYDNNNELILMMVGLFIAFFAHLGDMLESACKRYLKIKDTSNIIPGHGGVLDRIDALVMVNLYIAVITFMIGKNILF